MAFTWSIQHGTYAEYGIVNASSIFLKPKSLSFAQAAALPLVNLTAWQALTEFANVQTGQTVLIQAGAGGVGSVAIPIAKHLGATVYTTASPNRLRFTPDGKRVLISDGEGSSLVVLDAVARTEITRLDLAPNAVLVQPDGSRAYAALRGSNSVAVIDLDTLEITGRIPTGPGSGPGCMFWLSESDA